MYLLDLQLVGFSYEPGPQAMNWQFKKPMRDAPGCGGVSYTNWGGVLYNTYPDVS